MSRLLGCIVSSFEAVPNGRLHYRHIVFDKISALKQNKGNFEAKWEVDCTIYSDASTEGWGEHDKHHTINGIWTEGENKLHINVLELTAIKFAVFSLLPLQVGM